MYVYGKYYQVHGIRTIRQLMSPPMSMVNKLYLPMGSVYHCTDIDENETGVMPTDEVLGHINARDTPIFVEHVTALSKNARQGNPTELSVTFTNAITEYHREIKQFRRFNNPNLLNNPKALMVYSYNLITKHYRYAQHLLLPYFQWSNLFMTVIDVINRTSVNNQRQHFIQLDMPPKVPPLSHLEAAALNKDKNYVTRFNTDSLKVIADIYTWVSEHHSESLLANLDDKITDRVNFIFMHGGHFTTLNLGTLKKWRLEEGKKKSADVLEPEQLKRRYLAFLMSVSQVATVVDVIPDDSETTNDIDEKRKEIENEFEEGELINKGMDERIKERLDTQKSGSLSQAIAKTEKSTVTDVDDIIEDSTNDIVDEKKLDADLAELEVLAEKEETNKTQEGFYKAYQPPIDTPEAGVQRAVDKLARQGRLSAAEHRRLIQLSTRYKQLPNPYNPNETLEEMVKITPEQLAVNEKTPLAKEIPGVVDQSMLSSSLAVMDNHYIRNVMRKDIANAVLHVQKLGFIVQNYQVQQVDNITDSYEVLTINVIPVTGKASTLSIKLPRVNESGGFMAGGVKCRMRRQRGD